MRGTDRDGSERLTLDIPEVARELGISRSSAYEGVRRGDIPALRIGRRIVVSREQIRRMLASSSVTPQAAR